MYITWASMETSPATVTPPETDLGTVNVGWLPMRSCKGVASGLGELVPDVEPLTVVLVDLLTTDLSTEEMRA
jgi:hypothetical protein